MSFAELKRKITENAKNNAEVLSVLAELKVHPEFEEDYPKKWISRKDVLGLIDELQQHIDELFAEFPKRSASGIFWLEIGEYNSWKEKAEKQLGVKK